MKLLLVLLAANVGLAAGWEEMRRLSGERSMPRTEIRRVWGGQFYPPPRFYAALQLRAVLRLKF